MLPAYPTTAATRAWTILAACAVACVAEPDQVAEPDHLLLTGQYGGDGIGLVATAWKTTFEFRCAAGYTGPLLLGMDGVARAEGTWHSDLLSDPLRVEARPTSSMTLGLTVRIGDGPSLSFEARLDTPPDVAAICALAAAS